jgi:hypothetical protein
MKHIRLLPVLLFALLSAWGGSICAYHGVSHLRQGSEVSDGDMPIELKSVGFLCVWQSSDWKQSMFKSLEESMGLRSSREYFLEIAPDGRFLRLHMRMIEARRSSHLALNPDGSLSRLADQPFPGEILIPKPVSLSSTP